MNKFNKVAAMVAAAAFVSVAGAGEINNWVSADGQVWKSADGQCWRDAAWTPATAAPGCGGDMAPAPVAATPVPAPMPMPMAAPMAAPAPVVAAPTPAPGAAATKVSYAADVYFDTDKSVIKAEGKAKLDGLVSKVKDINLEVIIAVGHVDNVGGDSKAQQKLALARADAVKAYLVSKGIEKNRVYVEGKSDLVPAADNATAEGRAKNRRVEIEVVGTRAAAK